MIAIPVEFTATLKKLTSTQKRDEHGTPYVVTALGFEGDGVIADIAKKLVVMQRQGMLRITIVAMQADLPLATEKRADA